MGAASGDGARTVRLLAVGVGALWILDGLLQFLPNMGINSMAMVEMTGWGQPMWLVNVVDGVLNFLYFHHLTEAFDLTLAFGQLGVGLLIVLGGDTAWRRAGLWLSIPAALTVWFLGEWLGGLVTFWSGGLTYLDGGPGAVTLYALVAVLLLTSGRGAARRLTDRLRTAVGAVWLVGAIAQAVPANWAPGAVTGVFADNEVTMRLGWWDWPIRVAMHLTRVHPVFWNGIFTLVMAGLAAAIWLRRDPPWLYALAGVWTLFLWWVGENFGAVFGGASTDPNTGPPLALLLLPLFLVAMDRRRTVPLAAPFGRYPG